MTIFIDLIIVILIFIAVYTGAKSLLESINIGNVLEQTQWLLYLLIFTCSIGFIGLLIQSIKKLSLNNQQEINKNTQINTIDKNTNE